MTKKEEKKSDLKQSLDELIVSLGYLIGGLKELEELFEEWIECMEKTIKETEKIKKIKK